MNNYSLPRVILHNIVRSRRQYLGYLSATTLAVATFFSFGFFLFHPTLQAQLSGDVSSALSQLLLIGQIGVGLFAIFFVLFFHRFLLRLRAREFGLWLTLGISPRLLQRMVRIESVFLAILALTAGLLAGIGETSILFHVIAKPLNLPELKMQLAPAAFLYGIGFFIVLFGFDAWSSARSLRNLTPKKLMTQSQTSQGTVAVSRWKLLAGVAAIVVGYALALGFQNGQAGTQSVNMLPIVLFVGIGTYLLFSQGLTTVLASVRRKTSHGLTLISTSRLTHRVRDFARVLTVVSLLQAGVLTLTGVALAVLSHLQQLATSPAELHMFMQLFAVVLFVFLFLAFLFFVAALSTLWAKLFTQIDEDRRQFAGLRRIGLSPKEAKHIVSRELAVLFLAPAALAVTHATVAMGEFTTKVAPKNVSEHTAWLYFGCICSAYLLLLLAYFVLARARYHKSLQAAR